MIADFHSEILGDLFVYRLEVDFVRKQTVLIFSGHPEDNREGFYKVTFTDVVLQDIYHLQDYNIFNMVEVSDSYEEFTVREKNYLAKMKNYFTPGLLERVEHDKSLKYYYFTPTMGLSGFIICKEAVLVSSLGVDKSKWR